MKGLGKHFLYLAVLVAAINFVGAVLLRFLIMPFLLPEGFPEDKFSTFQNLIGLSFFIFGFLTSAFLVFLAYRLLGGINVYQEILDAVNRPLMILDENKRYVIINSEAERALNVSREKDIGKPVPDNVESRAFANRSGDVLRDCVVLNGVAYLPTEHNLPLVVNPNGKRSILILDNAAELVRLRKIVYQIEHDLAIIGSSTKQITDASQSLFSGTTRQAGSLSAISSSLDNFSQRIEGNSTFATDGTRMAAQAREAAERSGNEIANALSAMNDVQDAGVRIARIVKLIDDIAFQTNLLALNAAVEAARAGRQGKGFAVVADEVRNLAGRSAKAAKDTAVMVEDVTERIGNASAYISRLEEMLRSIMQDAVRMADSSAAASALSSEQASAIFQVNRELAEMNNLTQSTKSEAARTVSAVQDLVKLFDGLKTRFDNIPFLPKESENTGDTDIYQRILEDGGDAAESGFAVERKYGQDSARYDANYDLDEDDSEYDEERDDITAGNGAMWNDVDEDVDPNDVIPLPEYDDQFDTDDHATSRTDSDHDAPFKRMAALRKLQDDLNSFDRPPSLAEGPMEFSTNEDGDRVVKPNQSIQLDDTEFGRY